MSIFTVSRGTFLGGQALAESLARRLGYRCVSREEVLDAATAYGVPADQLTAAMEKPPSFWERLAGQRTAHLTFFRAALCDKVRAGNVVYHGYAGHLVLAGISHVIRARAIGDTEFRTRIAMEQRRVSHKEALALIEKLDRERSEWSRFLFGVEWGEPSLYDVVLNLSHMTIPTACDLLAHMAEQEEFRPTEESLKAMEDLALSNRVAAALASNPETAAAELAVAADGGKVTVSGSTHSPSVVEAIPLVAGRIEGVNEVRSEVRAARVRYEGT